MAEQQDISVRFWSKVDMNGPIPKHMPQLGPCWVWTACVARKGYGKFGKAGGSGWVLAHRWAWMRHVGPIPDETPCVLHKCDTPACVRPDHLWVGTKQENNEDKMRKGRHRSITGADHWTRCFPERVARGDLSFARLHPERMSRGEANGFAVMTDEMVRQVRRRYAEGEPQSVIADSLGLGRTTVSHVVHRRNWKHVR